MSFHAGVGTCSCSRYMLPAGTSRWPLSSFLLITNARAPHGGRRATRCPSKVLTALAQEMTLMHMHGCNSSSEELPQYV